ncbi:hypothetical protein [Catenulispora pinisilvae]|uniref:hypothetical protein n=1 Tax=Catenulispora pinisilvae TaxID=2705253 RepID=UPI00189203F7|nr:hypothetical protein [Catenulispora pinisilvae]
MNDTVGTDKRVKSPFAERALKLAFLLYPQSYLDQQGSEIAGTYAARAADTKRTEAMRDAVNLVKHALRVRLRLTSDRYIGAVLATALPYVLGSAAGLSGFMLYLIFKAPMGGHYEDEAIFAPTWRFHPLREVVLNYSPIPVLVTAAAMVLLALASRWTLARCAAAATVIIAAVTILAVFELRRGDHIFVLTTFPGFEMPLMLALFALMFLALPTDARTLAGQRIATIAVALAVVALLQLAWVREGFAWSLITAAPGVVTLLLSLALLAGLRNALVPGAVALACLPWLVQPLTGDLYDYGFDGTQYVLFVALASVLILGAGGVRHRSRHTSPE